MNKICRVLLMTCVLSCLQNICIAKSLIAQNWQPNYSNQTQSVYSYPASSQGYGSNQTYNPYVQGNSFYQGYGAPNQNTFSNNAQYQFSGSNLTTPNFPCRPFSAEFIAQSGERYANELRKDAIAQNKGADPETQANIQAALYSGGAAGIHQGPHGDCWFESALASVAHTPRGQERLANMIVQDSPTSYIVTYPWRNWSARVTNQDLVNNKTKDNALWARIIETATVKKWPNYVEGHRTAGTPFKKDDADVMGLSILTGAHAETFQLSHCSVDMLRHVLELGTVQQLPLEASSLVNPHPPIVVANHAYTIMNYDPATGIVTLRNPWARSGLPQDRQRFRDLLYFGESRNGVHDIGGGLIQMTVPNFKHLYRILVIGHF